MNLSLSHIPGKNWKVFQTVVQKYFEELKNNPKQFPRITKVETLAGGSGADLGRDIIIDLEIEDSVITHKIRWIVQCKCYAKDVNPNDLYGINIPTLVHKHEANGYLLVCKEGVTDQVVRLFDDLNKGCKMGYKYVYWTGQDFISKLLVLQWNSIYFQQHFNKYYLFMEEQEKNYQKSAATIK